MKTTNQNNSSRRAFFSRTAAIVGVGAAGAVLSSVPGLRAQSPLPNPAPVTDLDILQYALSLEHLENNFYKQISRFTSNDFQNSSFLQVFGTKITSNIFSLLGEIGSHEQQHVDTISTVIKSLGGTPVPPCTYNFGVNTADDFLKVAMALENTGVSAYTGAIGLLKNPDLIQAGATIATVEARHASYLNLINGAIPFPAAFDEPKTMQQVLAIAGQFIVSCPAGAAGKPPANPNAPTAVLSPSMVRASDIEVQLDATASQSVSGMAVLFSLAQISGPAAIIYGANTSQPRVRLSGGAGTYVFEETVRDANGNTATARSTIVY